MKERRTFATTNVRTHLRFCVNGAFMGSEIKCPGPRKLSVVAASEVPFAKVEIVRRLYELAHDVVHRTMRRVRPAKES